MRQLDRLGGSRNHMRWVAIACAATALTTVASGSAEVNAIVWGKLVKCIGFQKVGCPTQRDALVKVFDAQHHLVASEQITNGHFSFALKPGRYSLRADAPNETSPARRPVRINAHQTKRTTLVFRIPDRRQ